MLEYHRLVIIVYSIAELLLSVHISLSNLLVLWVFVRCQKVRTVTNTYIFSLALSDFLAGAIGLPATVFSVLTRAPHSFYGCMAIHIYMCILCTISIFHLLAIALDKYLTICSRDTWFGRISRQRRAFILITLAWVAGTGIAILPLFNVFQFASTIDNFKEECHFVVVVDYRYLVYVIFCGTILVPTFVIVYCYAAIFGRIRYEEQQIKCLLRASERERRMNSRRKLIRILLILVFTYAICWYPLYLINSIDLFFPGNVSPSLTLITVVLSHVSGAVNPLIYAYGMPGFKHALREFFRMRNTQTTYVNYSCYMKAVKEKSRSASVDIRHRSAKYNRKVSAPPMRQRTLPEQRSPPRSPPT
ncbi:hypothetical protein QR680_006346 [Steinernema hermaphroditum]|uniref:G-protein coupled receptors family 1 profile domain-containing protein n=1 Tax=Steinernema hermaphroditum TaxID=289476 RepID=A0AA39HV45_9BILA|nr:hypothetical protein QR680_006346 [Steinernema hermaphroditum]